MKTMDTQMDAPYKHVITGIMEDIFAVKEPKDYGIKKSHAEDYFDRALSQANIPKIPMPDDITRVTRDTYTMPRMSSTPPMMYFSGNSGANYGSGCGYR
jgi:hypothetical protein